MDNLYITKGWKTITFVTESLIGTCVYVVKRVSTGIDVPFKGLPYDLKKW